MPTPSTWCLTRSLRQPLKVCRHPGRRVMWKLRLQLLQVFKQSVLEMMKMKERGSLLSIDINTHDDFSLQRLDEKCAIQHDLIIPTSWRKEVEPIVTDLFNRCPFDEKLKQNLLNMTFDYELLDGSTKKLDTFSRWKRSHWFWLVGPGKKIEQKISLWTAEWVVTRYCGSSENVWRHYESEYRPFFWQRLKNNFFSLWLLKKKDPLIDIEEPLQFYVQQCSQQQLLLLERQKSVAKEKQLQQYLFLITVAPTQKWRIWDEKLTYGSQDVNKFSIFTTTPPIN